MDLSRFKLIESSMDEMMINQLTEISYKLNYYIRSLNKKIPDDHPYLPKPF